MPVASPSAVTQLHLTATMSQRYGSFAGKSAALVVDFMCVHFTSRAASVTLTSAAATIGFTSTSATIGFTAKEC